MPATSPSVSLYTLGRGILWIADRLISVPTYPDDFEDLGNVPKFSVKVTEEKLQHKCIRSGVRVTDKEVVLETGFSGSFDCDEISQANLMRYLKGSLMGNTIKANTANTAEYTIVFEPTNIVGERSRWTLKRLKLSPGGDLALIGESWETLSFTFEGLADPAFSAPDSQFIDVDYLTTTTV